MELELDVALDGKSGAARSSCPAACWSRWRARARREVSLELREAEHDVELTAGSSRFHLRTLPSGDFPSPEPEGDPVELSPQPLQETIGRVARAASRDSPPGC